MSVFISIFEFLFRLFAWAAITLGCLVYGLWAILCNRLKNFNKHLDETQQFVVDTEQK